MGELETDNYIGSTLPAPCLPLPDASPTANGSIVMANGPDAANELTKSDLSEDELRATCDDS